jgi:hypothetical protein
MALFSRKEIRSVIAAFNEEKHRPLFAGEIDELAGALLDAMPSEEELSEALAATVETAPLLSKEQKDTLSLRAAKTVREVLHPKAVASEPPPEPSPEP